MVLRGRNRESGNSQIFNVLVSCDDEAPFRPDGRQLRMTLRLADDDDAGCIHIGGHFGLWRGGDIGQGAVTRLLFV